MVRFVREPRLAVRLLDEERELIQRAAELERTTLSAFTRSAALAAARNRILSGDINASRTGAAGSGTS